MKALLAILLLASSAYAANISVVGPFSGLNDSNSSITIADGEAQDMLNVEVSEDLMALNKRPGFALNDLLTVTTSAVTGSHFFKDASGNEIRLVAHDIYVSKSVNGGAFSNIITSATYGAIWSFCSSDGLVYAFNSAHNTPWSYNGTALTYYTDASVMPKAALCAITPTRMLLAGTTDYPNRLYFSESGVFTNFTLGTALDSPSFDDIGLPGEKITAIFAKLSEWLIFKSNSLTSYQGTNQYDLVASVISGKVGMTDKDAIVEEEGVVYFKGSDNHIYGYASGELADLSKKIETFTAGMSKSSVNSKLYSTKDQFEAGTFYNTTSSMTSGAIEPAHFITSDTATADFAAGDTSDTALVVSTDELTMDEFNLGSFPNIGGEKGTTASWTGTLVNTSLGSLVGFGSKALYWAHGGAGAYQGCIEIKDSEGNQLYVQGVPGVAGTSVLDVTSFPDVIRVIFGEYSSVCSARATSPLFKRGPMLTYFTRMGCLTGCSGHPAAFDLPESVDVTSATFISRVHEVTAPNPHYGYITSTKTVPSGTQMDFFVAHSSATDGVFTAWSATTDYIQLTSTDTYWKYKVDLYNNSSYIPPILQSAGLLFRSTGYWESDEYNTGGVSSWGAFSANETNTGIGDWSYFIKVSSYAGGTGAAAYVSVTPGATITASTGTHVKVKAVNTFASATETVRMNDAAYSWTFTTDKLSSAFVFKNDIYFSVPYMQSATNNRTMKLDVDSGGWQIFDIGANAPLVIGDYTYFGSPTAGYWFQYPVGDNDNGAAINSYWKTKTYVGDNPYVEKAFNSMSVIAGSNFNSSLDVTYTLDTSTNTTYSIALTDSAADFVRNNRQLSSGDSGQFFNMQIGNNAADQPWSFYGASIDYSNNPWRVIPEE
jgi:hypothetical protein